MERTLKRDAVRMFGPAYRYPKAGWIYLHIEGQPYERGYQHGRLMAPEIAAHVRAKATESSPKAPSNGWGHVRTLVNAVFLRKFDREYLEEMKGIADGAADAGAAIDGRRLDILDIAAINVWVELDCLNPGLRVTPTGLEGLNFPKPDPAPPVKAAPPEAAAAAQQLNILCSSYGKPRSTRPARTVTTFKRLTATGAISSCCIAARLSITKPTGHEESCRQPSR